MERKQQAPRAPRVAAAPAPPSAPAIRMRAAVNEALAIAPGFLSGSVDAVRMANTMVRAVRHYTEQEAAAGDDAAAAQSAEAQALQAALVELMGCGSGFLAGRCDAACVARTMTGMLREFTPRQGATAP